MKKTRIKFRWPVKITRYNPDRDPRRSFTHTQQSQVWHIQDGKCGNDLSEGGCGLSLDLRTVVYHHIQPWYKNGTTTLDNCVALCPNCHQEKTFKDNLGNAEAARTNFRKEK